MVIGDIAANAPSPSAPMSEASANQRSARIAASRGDPVDVAARSPKRTSGPSARKIQIRIRVLPLDSPLAGHLARGCADGDGPGTSLPDDPDAPIAAPMSLIQRDLFTSPQCGRSQRMVREALLRRAVADVPLGNRGVCALARGCITAGSSRFFPGGSTLELRRYKVPSHPRCPRRLAAPIQWQRCFSEILVRGDFGCGSSFGFFTGSHFLMTRLEEGDGGRGRCPICQGPSGASAPGKLAKRAALG